MFRKEISVKEEIGNYLIKQTRKTGIKNKIVSLILYGSLQEGTTTAKSDVDIAVIVKDRKAKEEVEDKFLHNISVEFSDYFGAHLDTYIKTKDEFRLRLKRNMPPVSTLMKSYSTIWGKEPLDI